MIGRAAAALLVGVLGASLAGCYKGASRGIEASTFAREPGWISVSSVPALRQRGEHDCGPTVAAMLLTSWGQPTTGPEVERAIGGKPAKGLRAGRLRSFLIERGLRVFLLEGALPDLERELRAGRPVVVGVQKPYSTKVYAHYQIVVGVHPARRRLAVLDPADGLREYPFEGFVKEWAPTRQLMLVALAPAPP